MASIVLIDAVQAEILNKTFSPVEVINVSGETLQGFAPGEVGISASQVEIVFNTPPGYIRSHASQVDVVFNTPPGPVRTHASTIEVLHLNIPSATITRIAGMSIEVLRSISGKRRRGPVTVSAN